VIWRIRKEKVIDLVVSSVCSLLAPRVNWKIRKRTINLT